MEEIYLPIKKKSETTRVNVKDITYMEKDLRLLIIHIFKVEKETKYTVYGKIDDFIDFLGDKRFYRLNNSYLINFDKVVCMKNGEIILINGDTINVGINKYRKARKKFDEFIKNSEK